LTAANTYTGATIIGPGGDLVVQGSISNSSLIDVQSGGTLDVSALAAFTVSAGQTLRGSGSVLQGGPLTVNGTLSAGESNALGTLTLNNSLALTNGSVTSLRINKTGNVLTNDKVAGISTASYGGTLAVTNTGTTSLSVGDSFTLFGAQSGSGNFSSIVGPAGVGFSFNPNSGVLTVTSMAPTTGTTLIFSVSGGKLNLSWSPAYLGSILQSNSINLAITNDWFNVTGSASVTNESITLSTNGNAFFRLSTP
jgi:hypothetical protein